MCFCFMSQELLLHFKSLLKKIKRHVTDIVGDSQCLKYLLSQALHKAC